MVKKSKAHIDRDEFEGLLETLDILSNKKEVHAIAEGEDDVRRWETVSLGEYIACRKKS